MKINSSLFGTYTKVLSRQVAKNDGIVCGDYILVDRALDATTVILCDGIGSGVKANIAAVMAANALMEMLRLGFAMRVACAKMVRSMREARSKDIPFAAFTLCRVLNNGQATVISYEMPGAIVMDNFSASLVSARFIPMGGEVVSEAHFHLHDDRRLLICSDGVSQAGMGKIFQTGWGQDAVAQFVSCALAQGTAVNEIPEKIIAKVKGYSGDGYGDDVTAALIECCPASVLNILTGPACDKRLDDPVIERFIALEGEKAVCGSTTAEIVARILGKKVEVVAINSGYNQPPQYSIAGIDLVTEGAVTLNQVYNILEEDPGNFDNDSCVSHLARMLLKYDALNFIVGLAANAAHKNIIFRQMGVLPRAVIVEKIAQKLKKMGKLVNVEYI